MSIQESLNNKNLKPSNILANSKPHFYIISTLWLALQAYFFGRFGIVADYEAPKYIEQAQHLITHGHYTSRNFLFYSTEILLIAIGLKTGMGYAFAIAVQLIFNGLSVYCFYQTILHFTRSTKAAFLFTVVFLSMIYYHLYNVHLFTESLYYSFTTIYAFILFSIKKPTLKSIVLALLGLALLYFTRPTGIFFLPATLLYFIIKFYKGKTVLLPGLFITAALILMYFLLNFAMKSGGEFDFLLPYSSKMIICGVPTIDTPSAITIPVEKNTLGSLWYLITHHTSLFLELAGKRLIAFWGVVRPYYSLPHNLFIAIYFYTAYLLIIIRIKRAFKSYFSEIAFFSVVILLVMSTSMLSCDEWHNRFILALLPYLLFLACLTIYKNPKLSEFIC